MCGPKATCTLSETKPGVFKTASSSENQPDSELNDAAARASEYLSGGRHGRAAIANVRDGRARTSQVEMVECVEPVRAQLQAQSFVPLEEKHFHQADVPIPGAGAIHIIPGRIAIGPLLRRRERSG